MYPGTPQRINSLNGKLRYVSIKDKNGSLVKRTWYEYQLKESFVIKGLKEFVPTPSISSVNEFTSIITPDIQSAFYSNISEWWVLSSEKEENFINGQTVVIEKINSYDNFVHKQLTAEEFIHPDGSYFKTTYKYPNDFNAQQPYTDMVNKNIISSVIEKNTFKDNQPIATTRTNHTRKKSGQRTKKRPGQLNMKQK